MHIYDKLEYLCSLKKVSVPEAYGAMKINKGTISLWRTARDEGQIVIPSTKNAIKLSNYFGYPVDYFLNGNEVVQKEKSPTPEGMELDAETIQLKEIWDSADQEERKALLAMAEMLKARRNK